MRKIVVMLIIFLAIGSFFYFDGWMKIRARFGNNTPPTALPEVGDDNTVDFLNADGNFKIMVFAKNLPGARAIAFDPNGRMLVSLTKAGRVVSLQDADKDGIAEGQETVIDGLRSPHGLAFYANPKTGKTYLYIAETYQVVRYPYDISNGRIDKNRVENIANFPADGRHFTRTIAFGKNLRPEPLIKGHPVKGVLSEIKLYISVGSSCDTCIESSWKRAAILESDPDGNYTAEFASGLRNPVFFATHPVTGELWTTEMGRDNLGDNLPPDEINIARPGGKYGWPFCYGRRIKDSTFNPVKIERMDIPTDCAVTEPPIIEIPAHSAPLGLAFIPSAAGWPKEWKNNLLVALHGSWNRSTPTGYKIIRYQVDGNGKTADARDFITGFYDGKRVLGRPVDLKFSSNENSLYISDDQAGMIYRVTPK